MTNYIPADKMIAEIERMRKINREALETDHITADVFHGRAQTLNYIFEFIDTLQQEQPMPDSTKLIELWHEDKEMLKEKDFRNDPWRLAYNAFLCGFGRGIAVNKQEQPEVECEDLEEAAEEYSNSLDVELQSDSPDCFEEIIPAFKAGAEWGEKNAYKAIMKKADEVRDKRFDTDYEVKIEPAAGFDLGCINIYHEGKLVGQYVEPKEEEKFSEGVEEAAKKYDEAESWRWEALKYPRREAFEAGAKWQKEQTKKGNPIVMSVEDFQALIDNTIKRAEKEAREQMERDGLEGEVCGRVKDHINVRFPDGLCKYLEPKNISHIPADITKYKVGDKVRVIIVKEEEQ